MEPTTKQLLENHRQELVKTNGVITMLKAQLVKEEKKASKIEGAIDLLIYLEGQESKKVTDLQAKAEAKTADGSK